jgi:hypothetical protein
MPQLSKPPVTKAEHVTGMGDKHGVKLAGGNFVYPLVRRQERDGQRCSIYSIFHLSAPLFLDKCLCFFDIMPSELLHTLHGAVRVCHGDPLFVKLKYLG